MKNKFEKSESIKKKFNLLGWLSIIVYIIIFFLLCVLMLSSSSPLDSVWWLLFCAWIIPGFLLPFMAWIYTERHSLHEIKEDAVVVYRAFEMERRWMSGGYFHQVQVPVLVFELVQSKNQLKFKRLFKHFNFLRVGDAGTIIYKKKNDKYFFVNFIRK